MNNYKSSAELKGMAKEQLFGKYGTAVGTSVILLFFTLIMQFIPTFLIDYTSVIGLIIYYLVSFIISLFLGIFASGRAYLYLKVACRQNISVGDIFYGFRVHPDKALIIQLTLTLITYISMTPMMIFNHLFVHTQSAVYMLLMSIFTIIGSAIMIIASLILSQAFYLLQDFPQYSAKELLKMSAQIMKGHKGRLFYLQISFVPLYLLGILSCCIAFLWIVPYMNATMANFYMDLMKNRSSGNNSQI